MDLLNYEQAAELLKIKKTTLYSLVYRRAIPHVRLSGRIVRFRREELEAWVAGLGVRLNGGRNVD